MKRLRIAYIAETSPADKHAWSGTAHYVYAALRKGGFEVTGLGPARPEFLRLLLASVNKLSLRLFSKRLDYRHSHYYARAFGRIFSKKLKAIDYDLVVVCGGTEYGAYLRTDKPVYYVLDRTIGGAINYHEILKDLWPFSKKQSIEVDKRAMKNASGLLFSSPWAADHARNLYNIDTSKITVLPFGANLDKVPAREAALAEKEMKEWKLLLIGTYWYNKGADIAFNVLKILLERGLNASLTVAGCTPPSGTHHEKLNVIPFVDKNTESGLGELWQLYTSHHLFILPTRFDCTPIVFCESAAFGLPVLSADTGGVAGHVREGVNGFLIPYEDRGEAYANKILELAANPDRYKKMRTDSRTFFENTLNWGAWTAGFKKIISTDKDRIIF